MEILSRGNVDVSIVLSCETCKGIAQHRETDFALSCRLAKIYDDRTTGRSQCRNAEKENVEQRNFGEVASIYATASGEKCGTKYAARI